MTEGYTPVTRVISQKRLGEHRFATIEATYYQVPLTGHLYPEYAWIGNTHRPVRIDGGIASDLPWPMRMVSEVDLLTRSAVFVRTDVRGSWWRRRYWAARIRLGRQFGVLPQRVVLTAYIWGLIPRPPENELPSWRHLRRRK